MATILRSSKFVRYFAGFARSLVFSSVRGEIDNTFIHRSQCLNSELVKSLATQASPSVTHSDSNLERSLRRLDQDVRRTGRISRRELEDVLEELRLKKSATSNQSLLIIRCCGNLVPEESPQVRTKLVNEILNTLENIGVPMDVSHYNALLRVYLENEHLFSPTEFLANLEQKGIEPNRVTYQRLIARYCQQGDIEGATRILEFMREKQLPVNENVFNALIMGHSQADDMESAAGILGVMKQAGLEPSADTYTTLLCGYAKKGDFDSMMATLKECDAKDIELLDKDFMDIIYTLAANNQLEFIDLMINRLKQSAGYNQDAVNLILRLVNLGQEEIAYKIFLTMPLPVLPEGEQYRLGQFFVRQLVKVNRPIEKIKEICDRLEADKLNSNALLIALECSLTTGNVDQAYALLEVLKEKNLPVRQHYFWPLLVKHKNNSQSLLNIIKSMNSDFNMAIRTDTLKDYVIPYIIHKTADEIVTLLKNVGVSPATAACALVHYRLMQNNMSEAAQIALTYRANYPVALLKYPLVGAYNNTMDTDSFITILRQIHDSVDRGVAGDEDLPSTGIVDHTEIIDQFVLDIASFNQKDRVVKLEAVLQGLVGQGLTMSNSAAEILQNKLRGEELTNTISDLLAKLTSGDLVPSTVSRPATPASLMDEEKLIKLQGVLESKGESTRWVKRHLFNYYCRSRDLQKANDLVKELKTNDYVITGGMYAQLIELYTHHEKLDDIYNTLAELKERAPDFALDDTKIVRVFELLLKNNKLSDGVKLLSEQAREKTESRTFVLTSLCWRILNSLAEQGQVEQLKEVFDALVKYEYIEPNNVLLGPLIKVYIVKNDLKGAMEQFEWCCQKFRATPWKNDLACKMIQAEDAESLQRLTDLSTQIHGEVNSLYDLVFAFVECGRIRQARKILETPGLRTRARRLNSACERYQQEGMVSSLEGLVEATRDLQHIDRSDIYYHLLLSYCKAKDPDKALGLWTRMQEDDVQPSDEFLVTLGNYLKEEGRNVPFVIPEEAISSTPEADKSKPTLKTVETSRLISPLQQFRTAVRRNELDKALSLIQQIESSGDLKLTINDSSQLIERLIKANRTGEAVKLVHCMLENNCHPIPRIFRYLLSRLSAAGDITMLSAIGNFLSSEQKKLVSYDNRLCQANIVAGKSHEYLRKLNEEINNANESDIEILAEKYPRGGGIGIIQKHPELEAEFEQMALKYAEKGIMAPMNQLWMHLLVLEQEEKAKLIWDKYLATSPRIMFQYILQSSRSKQDENIPRKLIKQLKNGPASEGALGNAYSCLVDVLVAKENFDEALLAVKEALQDVCLENMNRTALLRLQDGLLKQGKSFPYEIPSKNTKSSTSSSSSSSDDEKIDEVKK